MKGSQYGLLYSDEGTGGVDFEFPSKVCQKERDWVLRIVWVTVPAGRI